MERSLWTLSLWKIGRLGIDMENRQIDDRYRAGVGVRDWPGYSIPSVNNAKR